MSFSTPRKIRSVSSATSAMSSAATSVGDEFEGVPEVLFPPLNSIACDYSERIVCRFLSLVHHDEDAVQLKRLVFRAVHMLKTCRYEESDIATVFAMGSLQYERFLSSSVKMTCKSEKTFIIVAHLYLAHCLVMDECCKISNWHKYLFASYCDLRSLNSAIAKILKKLDYQLFVDPTTVSATTQYILSVTAQPS